MNTIGEAHAAGASAPLSVSLVIQKVYDRNVSRSLKPASMPALFLNQIMIFVRNFQKPLSQSKGMVFNVLYLHAKGAPAAEIRGADLLV